jgi:hypothetical protein
MTIALTGLVLIALFPLVVEVSAQNTDVAVSDTVLVVLTDGSEIEGVLLEKNEETIVVRTSLQVVMTIPRDTIEFMTSAVGRRYLRYDPNVSRLMFAPTARAIGSGRGYVANYYLFFPFLAFGAGEHVSMAVGISLIPGSRAQIGYLAPKVTLFDSGSISVASGVIISKVLGDTVVGDDGSFGMAYGVTTLGSREMEVTVGVGAGFVNGDFSGSPTLVIGGDLQLSNRVKLMTENYLLFGSDDYKILSGGVRFFGRHLAVDIAMITTPDLLEQEGFPFLPFLDFTYSFGK